MSLRGQTLMYIQIQLLTHEETPNIFFLSYYATNVLLIQTFRILSAGIYQ